ncbi:unnamed protein product [Brassicogethes aeneus]|uniref:Interference hedgehog n=1 Tax=Brassicogethes aeneus TaxID=1431903 RepID=A0A9P0BA88_BRAAE|nr:unnamed protein product [Brassicogethes aeneus]
MYAVQNFYATILICCLVILDLILADNEYMVSKAETISLEPQYETKLTCEMNIEPDKFQWKFYPTSDYYNPKTEIDLSTSNYRLKPDKFEQNLRNDKHARQRKKSSLPVVADSELVAGDYQCLAYYGASVIASVPWRITMAKLNKFAYQPSVDIQVVEGNTVSWRCQPPESNPEAYIDYYRGDQRIDPPFLKPRIKTMLLQNVSVTDSGRYKCTATLNIKKYTSDTTLSLKVVRYMEHMEPTFIIKPKTLYTVVKGGTVFLDCSAVGNPIPKVVWYKKTGQLPTDRTEFVSGGLKIKNVTLSDTGVYECNHTNDRGTISHQITLMYNEEPTVKCQMNLTDVKQGEALDFDCAVTGIPEPSVTWLLNGFSVKNDSGIEAIGNKIYFKAVEKRHAGNLQIFARNSVKTVYSSISIRVVPLSTSETQVTPSRHNHRHTNKMKSRKMNGKHGKNKPPQMVPPTKPVITRVNDETVMVRWSVPINDGLPIQFFKVQYKEFGPFNSTEIHRGKGWKTMNADIPPTIKNHEVPNLKPDYIYRFRISAVFSNNDNKQSNISDKFHLRKLDFDDRNPLPVPILTETETVNSTSIRLNWKMPPTQSTNVTIEGFYISYLSSSQAGDYMTATVDGKNTKSYVISHLQPDMSYDIKLQSFNFRTASEFSSILKGKTAAIPVPVTVTQVNTAPASNSYKTDSSQLYIFVAVGVVLAALLIIAIFGLVVCRKWKQKKNLNKNDKPAVEEHHIQADCNDYVVGTKSLPRTNGCALPGNRITITSNPLADTDNKNILERIFSRIKTT